MLVEDIAQVFTEAHRKPATAPLSGDGQQQAEIGRFVADGAVFEQTDGYMQAGTAVEDKRVHSPSTKQ